MEGSLERDLAHDGAGHGGLAVHTREMMTTHAATAVMTTAGNAAGLREARRGHGCLPNNISKE